MNKKERCFRGAYDASFGSFNIQQTIQTKLEYVCISGFEKIKYATADKIIDLKSDMRNIMVSYPKTVGVKNT